MPGNEIVAWLRLRDLSRFRRDAKRAEESIEDLGDAGKKAGGPLNQLGEALSNLSSESKGAFGRTRLFGFAVGTVITALLSVIPLVIGLGGALVAVAGSAAAAAAGLAVLGVGFLGAGLAMGAFALVAAQGLSDFTKVNTAFQQWQKQVAAYGRNSTQAETALQNLNGILRVMGGPSGTILDAVMAWDKFTKGFRRANAGTMQIIFQIMLDLIQAATKFTGTFAYMAKTVAGAVRDSFQRFLKVLTSGGIQKLFRQLADSFAAISGPLTTAFINFFVAFLRLAVRIAPAVKWVADGVARLSQSFKNWTESANLGGLLTQLESWWGLAKAIVRLMLTLFSSGAKEGQGLVDTLTDVINGWTKWLQSIEGQKALASFFHDSVQMTKAFFSLLGRTIAFIFKAGRALVPAYTKIFNAIRDGFHQFFEALKPAKPFWNNVLKPLLKGLIAGIGTALVTAFRIITFVVSKFAAALGWLGEGLKPLGPAFEVAGHIIGFVFAGAILKALSGIGKFSILLKPLGFLFKALNLPIRIVTGSLKGLVGWARAFIGASIGTKIASGIINPISAVPGRVAGLGLGAKFAAFGNMWGGRMGKAMKLGFIAAIILLAPDIIKVVQDKIVGPIQKKLRDIGVDTSGPDLGGPGSHVHIDAGPGAPRQNAWDDIRNFFGMAEGGVVSGEGSWITGEAGPEINTLRNGRVSVVPLTPSIQAQGASASIEPSGGGRRVLVSKVYLRGRQIAEAVADEADDDRARR